MDFHRRLLKQVCRAHLDTLRARDANENAHENVEIAEKQKSQANTACESAERQLRAAKQRLAFLRQNLNENGVLHRHQPIWHEDQFESERVNDHLDIVHNCNAAFITETSSSSGHQATIVPLQTAIHTDHFEKPSFSRPSPNHSLTTPATPLSIVSPSAGDSTSTLRIVRSGTKLTDVPRDTSEIGTPALNLERSEAKKKSCLFSLCCVFGSANRIERRASRDVFESNDTCPM